MRMRVSICLWLYFWHQEQTVAHSSVRCIFLSDEYGALFVEDLFPARSLAGPWGSEDEREWLLPMSQVFVCFEQKHHLPAQLCPAPLALGPS